MDMTERCMQEEYGTSRRLRLSEKNIDKAKTSIGRMMTESGGKQYRTRDQEVAQ